MNNTVEREIYDAIDAAIRSGISVDEFREECRITWEYVLAEKMRADALRWKNP